MTSTRTDIIQRLIDSCGYESYLEIGIALRRNFDLINIDQKYSVDPERDATYRMTSDEFFKSPRGPYDIIFVDGLHLAEQTERDIDNSLNSLELGGSIVVHDCLPETEQAQQREFIPNTAWNGDVWKAVAKLRLTRADLEIYTVDTDYGCAVIRKGYQNLFSPPKDSFFTLSWASFQEHRNTLMNVISFSEFLERNNA